MAVPRRLKKRKLPSFSVVLCLLALAAVTLAFRHRLFSEKVDAVRVAIVIPFHRNDALERLEHTLRQWIEMPPCTASAASKSDKPHLFFNYAGNLELDEDVESHLAQLWAALPKQTRKCFYAPRTWSCKLSGAENVYPIGPCLQFHETFRRLKGMGFDHWLLFEPDVLPIRPGWGTRLIKLARDNQDCRDWWQLGSTPMHHNNVDQLEVEGTKGIDFHLNGNSIYCVKSRDFDEYRDLVAKAYPALGCYVTNIDDDLAGYDHALYRFRMRLENREYMQGKFSKFKDDTYIRNSGETPFLNSEDFRAENPQTMLVHSKYFYSAKKEQNFLNQKYLPHDLKPDITSIYWSALGRTPSVSEFDFFSRVFQPFYDNFKVMSCLFDKTISLCKTGYIRDVMTESCGDRGTLWDLFSSLLEATLTGRFVTTLAVIPGPEVSTLMCQSTELQPEAVCSKDFLSEFTDVARSRRSAGSNLAYVRTHVEPCTINERSQESFNRVLMGSYRFACDFVKLDYASDSLSCRIGESQSTLQNPFRCAADISVNADKQLVC